MAIAGEPPVAGAPGGQRRTPVYELMNPTDEQRVLIEAIMRENRDKMNVLHEDFAAYQAAYQASYDSLIMNSRERIALVFPVDQRAEYQRLLAENDRRRMKEREREREAAAAAARN